MAVQLINIGNVANDGTGDDLREAFIKVNQNFEELDLRDDEQTTASNLGATGEGIFANRVNYDLQFKKISAGNNITLTADTQKIVIASTALSNITLTADTGSSILENSATLALNGGAGISTQIVDGILTINNTGLSELSADTSPQLGGNLDAQAFNLLNVGSISASSVTSSFTGLINGYDPALAGVYFANNAWDFQTIFTSPKNIVEWLIYSADVDMGSINNPNEERIVDNGTFS
jgi:hypothetical protein